MTGKPPIFAQLSRRLAQPCPADVRDHMAPELSYGRHRGPPAWDVRHAAVILLLFPRRRQWHLPLTRRPESLPAHAGQISLPGGQIESGESPERAAARELWEELGVAADELTFLGRLSPIYVFASNYHVVPCVAGMTSEPDFRLNPDEVDRVIEAPLDMLLQTEVRGRHVISRGGVEFAAPHYEFSSDYVWGATSMLLAELAAVLGELAT